MKKSLIFLLLILSLSGCLKTEDIIPSEDYGTWDGNYIYYDNYRSKTTGEDEELLFETIQYDDLKYQIESFCDIKFHNNHIYYLANGFNPENNELTYFIIIYSFDELSVFSDESDEVDFSFFSSCFISKNANFFPGNSFFPASS